MKDKTLGIEVGRRLRLTARELGFNSQLELADWLGATRPQVYTWYRGLALPPVKYMQQLAERGVTLDWIYRGDGAGLSNAMYIRLTAAVEGMFPPEVGPEPQPASDSELTKNRASQPAFGDRQFRTERPKRASAA
jgi:hypothetical protein